MSDAEVWKFRYEALRSAVVGVCGTAAFTGRRMTGQECLDLIIASIKEIEGGGHGNIERETQGEAPAGPAAGV